MSECNPVSIPADPNNRPSPKMSPKTEEERHQMQKTPMREAIGSLMYLMAITRGDIALGTRPLGSSETNFRLSCRNGSFWNLLWRHGKCKQPILYKVSLMLTSRQTWLQENQQLEYYTCFMEAQSLGEADVNGRLPYQQRMLNSTQLLRGARSRLAEGTLIRMKH